MVQKRMQKLLKVMDMWKIVQRVSGAGDGVVRRLTAGVSDICYALPRDAQAL